MEKYAILYAGHANYRHLNELEFMYRTLVTECGFKPRNINILYYNGMLDCSGVPKPSSGSPTGEPYLLPIKGRGTRLELLDAIATLKNKLARDDVLLLHTSGHGDGPSTYDKDTPCSLRDFAVYPPVTVDDIEVALADLPRFAQLVTIMTQCHSGGFISGISRASPADSTYLCAACPESGESIASEDYNPFGFHWIAAWHHLKVKTPRQAMEYAEHRNYHDEQLQYHEFHNKSMRTVSFK